MKALINQALSNKELADKIQSLALNVTGNRRSVLILVNQFKGLIADIEELVYCQIYAGSAESKAYLMTEFVVDDLNAFKKRVIEQLFFVDEFEIAEDGRINDDVLSAIKEIVKVIEERKKKGYEIEDNVVLVTNAVDVKYEDECYNATVYSECVKCGGELETIHYDSFYPSITAKCVKCEQFYSVVPGKEIK